MAPRPTRAKERLINVLREAIASGQLPRGQRLTELSLVEALGISRTPVREALQTLYHLGLLTQHESGRGFEVKGYTVEEACDLYFVRSVLEEAAVKRAAKLVTDDDIAELRHMLAEERADLERGVFHTFQTSRHDVHGALVRLSGSVQLQRSFATLVDQIRMVVTARRPDAEIMWNTHREHVAIVEAVAARDGDLAQQLIRQHLQHAVDYLRADPSRLEPSPQPLDLVLDRLRADLSRQEGERRVSS